MSGPLDIEVNGEPRRLAESMTVATWLESLGRDPRLVAIERNGEIVPRTRFAEVELHHGDRLEIVGFVQGG